MKVIRTILAFALCFIHLASSCEDRRSDCDTLLKQGFCVKQRASSKIVCQKTCKYCDEETANSSKASPTTKPTCQDQRGQCKPWRDLNYCELYKERMRTLCPDSCGYCNVRTIGPVDNNPSRSKCKDRMKELCRRRKAMCHKRPQVMKMMCAATCNMCHVTVAPVSSKKTTPITTSTKARSIGFSRRPATEQLTTITAPTTKEISTMIKLTTVILPTTLGPEDECKDYRPDCKKLQATSFCVTGRKLMEDQCPLTCGYCEPHLTTHATRNRTIIKPITGHTTLMELDGRTSDNLCTDKRPDCSNLKHLCELKRQSMEVYCALSCGFCKIAVLTTTPKSAVITNTKSKLPDNTSPIKSIVHVRITTKKVTKASTKICMDMRPDCVNLRHMCETNREIMELRCALTCSFCVSSEATTTTPVTTTTSKYERCMDLRKDCEKLKKRGLCVKQAKIMQLRCTQTCGFCHTKTTTTQTTTPSITTTATTTTKVAKVTVDKHSECVDREQNCLQYKQANYCVSASSIMKIKCPRTCGFCDGVALSTTVAPLTTTQSTTKFRFVGVCKDRLQDCHAKGIENQMCENGPKDMRLWCPVTCGYCTPITTPKPTTTSKTVKVCKDLIKTCYVRGVVSGDCSKPTKRNVMAKVCRKTCNLCDYKPTTAPLPADCVDKHLKCSKMSKQCTRIPRRMFDQCRRTCNMCHLQSPPPRTLTTRKLKGMKTCTDRSLECHKVDKQWCKARRADMRILCPATCNLCKFEPAPTTPPACIDKMGGCDYFKRRNWCSRPQLFLNKCDKTCGWCGRPPLTHRPSPEPQRKCHDTRKDCQRLKDRDYCTRNEAAMNKECPSTCSLCDRPAERVELDNKCSKYQDQESFYKCDYFLTSGQCDNPAVKKQCHKTCGCIYTSLPTIRPQVRDTCQDDPRYAKNICTRYKSSCLGNAYLPTSIRDRCMKTCNLCIGADSS